MPVSLLMWLLQSDRQLMADIQMDKFWQDRGLLPGAETPDQTPEPEPEPELNYAARTEALRAAIQFCQDDPSVQSAQVVESATAFFAFLTGKS